MNEEKDLNAIGRLDDDDIFYSDSEDLDESNSVTDWNTDYTGNLVYTENEFQVDAKSCTNFYTTNTNSNIVNPVDQICSGMKNLLNEVASSYTTPSYSAITRRSHISNPPNSAKPLHPPQKCKIPNAVTSSTSSTPYRFISKNPVADPRYPYDQQLVLGPIPGHLNHDNIYSSLRGFFQTRGAVQFMFIHKGAVKIQSCGDKSVKFGYVVFAKKGPAQDILKEATVTLEGHSIKVKAMDK